jgi:hypothetical protein
MMYPPSNDEVVHKTPNCVKSMDPVNVVAIVASGASVAAVTLPLCLKLSTCCVPKCQRFQELRDELKVKTNGEVPVILKEMVELAPVLNKAETHMLNRYMANYLTVKINECTSHGGLSPFYQVRRLTSDEEEQKN